MIDPSAFISTHLSALLSGRRSLNVVAMTYNTIDGFPDGAVQTDKEGLSIFTAQGDTQHSILGRMLLWRSVDSATDERTVIDSAMMGLAIDRQESAAGVSQAEAKMQQEAALDIFLIYAGFSATDRVLQTIRRVSGQYPNCKIITVSCDCDIESRKWAFQPYLNDGRMDHLVVTRECGGYEAMKDLLRAIIDQWQPTVTA